MLQKQDPYLPEIRTELPGPRAQAVIAKDERFTSPANTRYYPLVVDRAQGAVVTDVDGNRFLDFIAGIAVCSTGHCHPTVVEAVQSQADKLLHMCGADFYYEPFADLAARLAELAPGNSKKRVYFGNSGAEAIEAAIKMARYHTKRQQVIAFHGGFHGRTLGALSLTCSKTIQRRGFSPFLPGVKHVDYSLAGLDDLEHVVFKKQIPPEEVAAVVVEPIQGEGGYIVPPDEFHPRLKSLCEQHGILFIVDEIQAGMGRTGKMFAIEHWGVEPDAVCAAKGIASGLPLGVVIARDDVMDWPPGAHASTFGGNPVCCAAALATLSLLEECLMKNAAEMGDWMLAELRKLEAKHPLLEHVRGKGLMIGVDVGKDTPAGEHKLRDLVLQSCFAKGLILLSCGEHAIRFCPPLVINQAQAETALAIFEEAVVEVGQA